MEPILNERVKGALVRSKVVSLRDMDGPIFFQSRK